MRMGVLITAALLTLMVFSGIAGASNGDEFWVRFYGSGGNDELTGLAILPNGDLVAAGSTEVDSSLYPWVLRLDRYGDVLWSKYYVPGGNGLEVELKDVSIDDKGDVIAVGTVRRAGTPANSDLFVMKLDDKGNPLWAKVYGLSESDMGTSVVTAGSSVFVAGYTEVGGEPRLWVLRLNPYGSVIWQRTYSVYPSFKHSLAFDGGDLLATGTSEDGSPVLLRINPISGTVKGAVEYTAVSGSNPAVVVSESGSAIVTSNGNCLNVLNLNGSGSLVWARCYKNGISNPVHAGAFYLPERGLFVGSAVSGKTWILGVGQGGSPTMSVLYNLSSSDVPTGLKGTKGYMVLLGDTGRFSTTRGTDGFIAKLPYNGAMPGYTSEKVDPSVFGISGEAKSKGDVSATITNALAEPIDLTPKDLPQGGILRVKVSPESGSEGQKAELYIDGNLAAGIAGETVLTLPPGTHSVKVVMENHYPYETTVNVRSGQEETLNVELIPKAKEGALHVDSSPSGAAVFLNGTLIGFTPLSLNLTPGTYELRVTKEGYGRYSKEVEIEAGKELKVSVTLEPMTTSPSSTTGTTTTTTTSAITTTPTSSRSTTTSSPETSSGSSTSSSGGGGICGPGAILLLALALGLFRRGR